MGFGVNVLLSNGGVQIVHPLYWLALVLWAGVIIWWLAAAARSATTYLLIGCQAISVLLPVFADRQYVFGPSETAYAVIWNVLVTVTAALLLAIAHFWGSEKVLEKILDFLGAAVCAFCALVTVAFSTRGGGFPDWISHLVPLLGFAGLWLNIEKDCYFTESFQRSASARWALWIVGFTALILS